MTSEDKRNIAIMGAIALAAFLMLRGSGNPPAVITQTGSAADGGGSNTAPGGWIPDAGNYQLVFGPAGQPFYVVGGDTVINMPDYMLGSLSRQYIPMFGYVGVAAVGSM